MSESLDEKRRWTEALDAEGAAAVRRVLERSRALPPGLIRIGQTWVTQTFAKAWLDRHASQRVSRRKKSFLFAVAFAVAAIVVAWLLGWR